MEEINKAVGEVKRLQELAQQKMREMTNAQYAYIEVKNQVKMANIKLATLMMDSKPARRKYPRPDKEWKSAFIIESGSKCFECASGKELTVHHLIPLAAGGSNDKANLKVLCRTCHDKKHSE